MKKIEQSILEVHRRIPVVRTIEDGVQNDLIKALPTLQKKIAAPAATKKTLNIPIGDVNIDQDYNKDVTPTFKLPTIYVKHIKKIGDEADVSLDYILDLEDEMWIKSLGAQGVPKDICKAISFDNFETAINILERYTGLSKEPIPQINATKLVTEELQWTEAITLRLLPMVYSYWLGKRNKHGKPLCRKYWPQVNSSDTNPRQVFRARDKEKYRLRKQQKRNDVDAFRKMQQLRKEFTTAKNLLQLILERELLREAEFDIQREVFEQTLHDAGIASVYGAAAEPAPEEGNGTTEVVADAGNGAVLGDVEDVTSKSRRVAPFRHELRFEDLVYPPEMFRTGENVGGKLLNKSNKGAAAKGADAPGEAASDAAGGFSSGLLKKPMERKRKRDRDSQGAVEGATVLYTYDSAGNVLTSDAGAAGAAPTRTSSTGASRAGRNSSQFRAGGTAGANLQSMAGAGTADIVAALQGDAYLSLEGAEPLVDLRTVLPDLDGPGVVCQQPWPSFMETRTSKNNTLGQQSVADYIDDLELRTDVHGAVIPPKSFRCRCRVGRGGRLVMDRIPVYDSDEDVAPTLSEDAQAQLQPQQQPQQAVVTGARGGNTRYLYPTSLPYQYPGNAYNLHFPAGLSTAKLTQAASLPGQQDSRASSLVHESAKLEDGSEGPLSDLPLSNARFALNLLRNNRNNTTTSVSNNAITPWVYANSAACVGGALNVQQRSRLARVPKVPVLGPSGRPEMHAAKAARLSAILCASDSEDERIYIPKFRKGEEIEKNVGSKTSAVEQIKFKYVTNVC